MNVSGCADECTKMESSQADHDYPRTVDPDDDRDCLGEPVQFEVIDRVIVPALWSILIVVGFLGNGLVVYVMFCYGEVKATNRYIANLALTDLAFVIVVVAPTMLHYVLHEWIFGRAMCKFHMYMIYVTLQATCLTLAALTVDRYFAIVHPIKAMNKRTPNVALVVNIVIWIVSLVLGTPFAYFHDVKDYCGPDGRVYYCRPTWPRTWGLASITYVVTVTYVVPLCIFVVCYTKMLRHLWKKGHMSRSHDRTQRNQTGSNNSPRRRRTTQLVAVVVVLFATLWLPIHVFQMWSQYDKNFRKTLFLYIFKIVGHTLSYANSVINPFLYSFLSEGFRKAMRKAFSNCHHRLSRSNERLGTAKGIGGSRTRDDGPSTAMSLLPQAMAGSEEGMATTPDLLDGTRNMPTERPAAPMLGVPEACPGRKTQPIVPRPACTL